MPETKYLSICGDATNGRTGIACYCDPDDFSENIGISQYKDYWSTGNLGLGELIEIVFHTQEGFAKCKFPGGNILINIRTGAYSRI